MASGKIVKVSEKGFGFIKPAGQAGGNDIYFHVTKMTDRARFETLKTGDEVTYEVGSGKDNRPEATDVAVVE